METLKFSIAEDGIASIVIDLPNRSMNVLTPQLIDELITVVEQVATDTTVLGAVVTSGKVGSFVAGADITHLLDIFEKGISAVDASRIGDKLSGLMRRMETCGKPFAAAINGLALGGGLELALACHYRVLADHPKAVVGLPEVGLGLLPGGGGTQRLPRMIGIEKAAGLLLTGKQIGPQEALKLGIVNALASESDTVETAAAWLRGRPSAAQPWDVKGFRIPGGVGPLASHAPRTFTAGTSLLAQQTQRNYPAPLAIASALFEGTQVPLGTGLRIEANYFGQLLAGPVARNLMRTMFVNKGEADRLVKRPPHVPKSAVRKLGVLGAGMMGAGIAYSAAKAGIHTVLLDTTIEAAERGKQYSAKLLEKDLGKNRITRDKADAILARIAPTIDYSDLAGCDYVVEAVFENRAIKAEATRKAEAVIGADAVFGSNTSTLPITGLAETSARPGNFIGIHFFSPVERMPLIEIITGAATSDVALARTLDFVEQLRKTPIVVKDSRGFFTSRVFGTYIKEGVAMMQEGILPALIENGARQAGMPIGPLAVLDEVSLDITLKVYDQWVSDGTPPPFEPALSVNAIKTMVHSFDRKGRASGAGFYDYPKEGKKFLWPQLGQHFPIVATQPDVDEVKQRVLYVQAMEAARCVEEGIVSAEDADIGSILGIGYPAWTGGTISFIETVGLTAFVAEAERLALLYGPRFQPSPWLKERAAGGKRLLGSMSAHAK
ncbi:3-hydroxyacyl-CoA dehydrogenase NAD-binding domain-containing protein [Janthinobacterium sp. PC23-8]|uniref:3-hydroxyacyl-CoA dehydrogenase NAD-binding domain-containing protein n=1 Tax=Janthinobacterium sp. PC23-8 TaxID=2012679 RepID=UPI000B978E0D|nr:3-hydroxyacyl-CoA dehydrogenase NAD-binding domain-containing protein [Janthinobacterium sp. PC23-8]OYO26305.1 3-hydroxyacyl-CoA dehydrogenase [Janthinobacterium sp. PC23-8]